MQQERRHFTNRRGATRSLKSGLFVLVCLLCLIYFFGFIFNESRNDTTAYQIDRPIDIWPNDRQSETSLSLLTSCLPESDPDKTCRLRRKPGASSQNVGVVRPPGLFGMLLQSFVEEVVSSHPIQHDEAILNPINFIQEGHEFTNVVRLSVLPMLLQAADLMLDAADTNTTDHSQFTTSDVEETIRELVQWHCHLSKIANDTALLTLSGKKILSRPREAARELGNFLGFQIDRHDESLMNGEPANFRAKLALQRIDECASLLQQLQQRNPEQDLQDMADNVVRNVLVNDGCRNIDDSVHSNKNRVTTVMRHLLGPDSANVCETFSTIKACTKERQKHIL